MQFKTSMGSGRLLQVFSADGNGDPLDGGVYNCTVTFTDLAGNVAPNMLNLTGFQVHSAKTVSFIGPTMCITGYDNRKRVVKLLYTCT